MRRISCLIIVFLITVFTACATPAAAPAVTPTPEPTAAAPTTVAFADPLLEKMVRDAMGKPEGDITIAEAEAIQELKLGIEWQKFIPEEQQIKDLSGLENFRNLEVLELHFHKITDVSPLAGLTKLVSLALGGNPVADITPLSGMTNLQGLTLFNCAASDYSTLAKLTNLDFLMLEYSSFTDTSVLSGLTKLGNLSLSHTQVSDVSPLAGLTNLHRLLLAECPITDYSPLAGIYPSLEESDFTMAASLSDLGFTLDLDQMLASCSTKNATFTVNHSEWGKPQMDLEADSVRMDLALENGYYLTVGRYPAIDAYVFAVRNGNETLVNYVYDSAKKEFNIAPDKKEAAQEVLRAALGESGTEDILLAPVPIFDQQVMEAFSMSADQLFLMPFEERSLVNLGFVPDQKSGKCVYEQLEGEYVRVSVNRPEWGGNPGWDIEYYTEINGNPLLVWYYVNDRRFYAKVEYASDGTIADFEYFPKEGRHQDGMVPANMSVSELMQIFYNDTTMEDPYAYTIQMVQQYFQDRFRVNENDLYDLPVGD